MDTVPSYALKYRYKCVVCVTSSCRLTRMKPQSVVVEKMSALTSEVLRVASLEWPQVKIRDYLLFVENN